MICPDSLTSLPRCPETGSNPVAAPEQLQRLLEVAEAPLDRGHHRVSPTTEGGLDLACPEFIAPRPLGAVW
jgi:hypothetical protein